MDLAVGAGCALLGALLGGAGPWAARWSSGTDVGVPRRSFAAVAAVVVGVLGASIGWDAVLPAYVVFGLVSTVLLLVDLELHRLPDRLTLPAYPVGVLLLGVAAAGPAPAGDLLRAVAGSAATLVGFTLLFLIAGAGLGAGDVKYAGVLGLHLAWFGWPVLISGLLLGFVLGGLAGGVLLVLRRASWKSRIPFGPPLIIGTVLAIALGAP